jgi:hypothetical protein
VVLKYSGLNEIFNVFKVEMNARNKEGRKEMEHKRDGW